MREPHRKSVLSFLLVPGLIFGVAVVRAALADSEEPAAGPAAPIATPEAAAAAIATPGAVATPISTAEAVATPLTGRQVYSTVCIACHAAPGVGGAPPLGDGNAWAPRIAQGMDTLIDHALNGFTGRTGVMPKKGERLDLSDEEVIGAVRYMVEQVAR